MAENAPDHAAVWARQLMADLQGKGHSVEPILDAVGLKRDALNGDGARIAVTANAAIFELAAQLTEDDCLGLHFGQTRDVRDAGLLGYVGISSATLGAAFKNLSRYSRVFSDALEIDVGDLDKTGDVRWGFRMPPSHRARQMLEFSATNLVHALRQLTGRNIVPIELGFAHPRNEHLDSFNRFVGCTVAFGESGNHLRFRPADLASRLISADDRLLAVLRPYCEEVLARRAQQAPSLVEKVERLIVQRLTEGEAKADTIARELGMTRRTLTRKLAELGTSFQTLLEGLRKELALRYLEDGDINLTEIAFLLGYADASAFHNAFKRWTGRTPIQARRAARRTTG